MIVDREEFRSWLVAHDPDAVVGIAYRSGECPMTNFVRSELGLTKATTHSSGHIVANDGTDNDLCLPWVAAFASRVDVLGTGHAVTAKNALTILDSIDLPAIPKEEGS